MNVLISRFNTDLLLSVHEVMGGLVRIESVKRLNTCRELAIFYLFVSQPGHNKDDGVEYLMIN
jgi:hypothetical protein